MYMSMNKKDYGYGMDGGYGAMGCGMGGSCGCGCGMPQMSHQCCQPCGTMCDPCQLGPIYEAPIEKCVQKEILHEVQHICPINTKVINNHVYRHVYAPQYSCCEEDVVTNIDQGSCCNFQ